jgi:hypothetical protein
MSMDLDAAVEFFRQVIEREHAMHVAAYTERDEAIYAAIAAQVQNEATAGARFHNWRPTHPDARWFEQGDKASHDLFEARRLFQVKAYAHPMLGTLYRAYVGHTTRAVDDQTFYFASWFAVHDGRWQIISTYELDPDTEAIDTGLGQWVHTSGVDLDPAVGALLGVRKIEAPGERRDREEYDAE